MALDFISPPPRSRPRKPQRFQTLDLPSLSLASNLATQRNYEHLGHLLQQSSSLNHEQLAKVSAALLESGLDLSKAQDLGHSSSLVARLAQATVSHVLFAKGQIAEPVAQLKKKYDPNQAANPHLSRTTGRLKSSSNRKQIKLVQKLDHLLTHLENAFKQLDSLDKGEGPSSNRLDHVSTSRDIQLLIVLGPSASMPKEIFAVSLVDALSSPDQYPLTLDQILSRSQEILNHLASDHAQRFSTESAKGARGKAREKTVALWERKLVRFLISDQHVESNLGNALPPTKMHILLLAPKRFRCPGWMPRQHLSYDLSELSKPPSSLSHKGMLSDEPHHSLLVGHTPFQLKPIPSDLTNQASCRPNRFPNFENDNAFQSSCSSSTDKTNSNGAQETCSISSHSRTSSWQEENLSETAADSSLGSAMGSEENITEELARLSEALSPVKRCPPAPCRPSSMLMGMQTPSISRSFYAFSARRDGGNETNGWLGAFTPGTLAAPRLRFPTSSNAKRRKSIETPTANRLKSNLAEPCVDMDSKTNSPCNVLTVRPTFSQDQLLLKEDNDTSPSLGCTSLPKVQLGAESSSNILEDHQAKRRSKPPHPDSLLERNRIKSGTTHNRRLGNRTGKGPRLAGLELSFTLDGDDYEKVDRPQEAVEAGSSWQEEESLWFLCESVLEGYR